MITRSESGFPQIEPDWSAQRARLARL